MLKIPFGILAVLVLLYLGFYVLPGALWADKAVDLKTRCEDELLALAEQSTLRHDDGLSPACQEMVAQAGMVQAETSRN